MLYLGRWFPVSNSRFLVFKLSYSKIRFFFSKNRITFIVIHQCWRLYIHITHKSTFFSCANTIFTQKCYKAHTTQSPNLYIYSYLKKSTQLSVNKIHRRQCPTAWSAFMQYVYPFYLYLDTCTFIKHTENTDIVLLL